MADYREISQQYAKGAINAAILVNGGAAVAVLAQAELAISLSARIALGVWAVGILAGAATWVLGFISTRFVDNSEQELNPKLKAQHIETSNRYMAAGVIAIVVALACFAIGAIGLAVCWPGTASGLDGTQTAHGRASTVETIQEIAALLTCS